MFLRLNSLEVQFPSVHEGIFLLALFHIGSSEKKVLWSPR